MDQSQPLPKGIRLDDYQAWRNLKDAYGSAKKIPQLLQTADITLSRMNNRGELWSALWSALYHQGSIFSAPTAVVSYLREIVNRLTTRSS